MTSLLFVGDTHFRSKSTPHRIDNFYEEQFKKLQQILDLGAKHQVEGIIFLGDFFHTSREGYELTHDLIGALKKATVPCLTIVGNHDLFGYQISTLKRSPLGILIKAGVLQRIEKDQVFSNQVVVRGIDYMSKHMDNLYQFRGHKDYFKIVCSHNMILPVMTAPFDFINPENIDSNSNLVVCGHYHLPFDYTTRAGVRYINPGVPIRWTITEARMVPQVLLVSWDGQASQVQYIPLQYNMEAFDLEGAAEKKQEKRNVEYFVKTLETTTFNNSNIEESISKYSKEQTLDQDIVTELLRRVGEGRQTYGS